MIHESYQRTFPAPLYPITPKISLRLTLNDTSFKACIFASFIKGLTYLSKLNHHRPSYKFLLIH